MRTPQELEAKLKELDAKIEEDKPLAFGNVMATIAKQALTWVLGKTDTIYGE